MKILCMHTSTEWSSSALTALNDASIREFSRTPLIIQKSEIYLFAICVILSIFSFHRVLLATIRDKGLCPCPRCLVPMAKLDRLGFRRDISIRVDKFRTFMASRVRLARRAIYELAKPIGGKAVEDLLKSFSGVPTMVAIIVIRVDSSSLLFTRMLLSSALEASLILPVCLLLICYMNSNSGSGRHFSPTSSAYFMLPDMDQISSLLSWTSGKTLLLAIV